MESVRAKPTSHCALCVGRYAPGSLYAGFLVCAVPGVALWRDFEQSNLHHSRTQLSLFESGPFTFLTGGFFKVNRGSVSTFSVLGSFGSAFSQDQKGCVFKVTPKRRFSVAFPLKQSQKGPLKKGRPQGEASKWEDLFLLCACFAGRRPTVRQGPFAWCAKTGHKIQPPQRQGPLQRRRLYPLRPPQPQTHPFAHGFL